LTLLIWFCATFFLAGCGKGGGTKGFVVKGQVLVKGQPLKLRPNEELTVSFSPANAAGKGAAEGAKVPAGGNGTVKGDDGTFTLSSLNGQGIPPGTYEVRVSSQIYGGDGTNRFEQLFDEAKAPLIAEVGDKDGQNFIVDLGNWTVSKQ
jgi:hypothetical protein